MLIPLWKHSYRERLRKFSGHRHWACGRPVIVLGDSHSGLFTGQEDIRRNPLSTPAGEIYHCVSSLPVFRVFHLGPGLAYNLDREGSGTRSLEKIRFMLSEGLIRKGDPLLLCFGEIDCRVHLARKLELPGALPERVVEPVLETYLRLVRRLRRLGFPVWCWGPVASQPDPERFVRFFPNASMINHEFPTTGDELTRNRLTRAFTEGMKKVLSPEARVVTILDELMDAEGRTRPEWFSDGCHLNTLSLPLAGRAFAKEGLFSSRGGVFVWNPD